MKTFDVIIIGGGIIGLATAMELLKNNPHLSLAILEKEDSIAKHQTGHNSGVIHSGIYYRPGSLKAKNCIEGVHALKDFCNNHNIPYHPCGKVIIATKEEELPRLEELERRGKANGVEGLEMIGPEQLKEIEPHVAGIKALYSPKTAVVDFVKVAQAYAKEIKRLGGSICLTQEVREIHNHRVVTQSQEYAAKWIINCGGVQADRIAHMTEKDVSAKQIIPFRGEYYELIPEKRSMINGLIYPVPDPSFPFLGVHLSRTIDGAVEAGPNAILALSRNGYQRSDINLKDCWSMATYPGFWVMAARYWKIGLYEIYRSFSKKAFLNSLQRLIPSLEESDLVEAESGVRSQVVLPNGKMHDDFSIVQRKNVIHVLNAPSPGATASLAIGKHIASYVSK